MAVGTTPLTFYQGENIAPRFTIADTRVTDVTGWATSLVIKDSAADLDPPLHEASGVVYGAAPTLTIDVPTLLPLTLAPGTYVYSFRREDAGYDWQLAHGIMTIVDSAHKDTA